MHTCTYVRMYIISTGDSGVVHVAEGLASNSTLEMLLLADNPFGDEGGLRLTEVLCTDNTTLKVLDLHGTHMTKVMERKVVEDLHQHGHLTKLGTAFGTKSPSPQHSFSEQNGLFCSQTHRHTHTHREEVKREIACIHKPLITDANYHIYYA